MIAIVVVIVVVVVVVVVVIIISLFSFGSHACGDCLRLAVRISVSLLQCTMLAQLQHKRFAPAAGSVFDGVTLSVCPPKWSDIHRVHIEKEPLIFAP